MKIINNKALKRGSYSILTFLMVSYVFTHVGMASDVTHPSKHRIKEMHVVGKPLPFESPKLTRHQIKSRQYRDVKAAINSFSNVTFKSGGGQKSVFVRGASSNHTLVILDGMILNDPSNPHNTFDFNAIDMESLASIDVIAGPKASFYGTGALGGVLVMKSKMMAPKSHHPDGSHSSHGMKAVKTNLHAEGGTNGHNLQSLSTEYAGEKQSVYLALRRHEQGQRQRYNHTHDTINSDYEQSNLGTIRLGIHPNAFYSGQLYVQGFSTRAYVDGFDMNKNVPVFDGSTLSQNGMRFALSNTFTISDTVKTSVFLYHSEVRRRNQTPFANNSYLGKRTSIDFRNHIYFSDALSFEGGIVAVRDQDQSPRVLQAFEDRSEHEVGFYMKGVYDLSQQTSFYVSGRHDTHSRFQGVSTWQTGVTHNFSDTLKAEMNVGTGFKFPSLATLYGSLPFQNPNPLAKPERSLSADISLEKRFIDTGIIVKGGVFMNAIHDVLVWNQQQKTVDNIDKRISYGFESTVIGNLGDQIQWRMAYTYTNAVDEKQKQSGNVGNLVATSHTTERIQAIDIPTHKVVGGLDYRPKPDLHIFTEIIYASSRKDYTGNIVEPTTDIRLGFTYDITERVSLNGRIENAIHEKNESVYGYGRRGIHAIFGFKVQL